MEFRILWNLDGRHGTEYIEILPGEFNGKYWNVESAFIDEEEFAESLEDVFVRHAPDFDHYGITVIGEDACWIIIDSLKSLGNSSANELAHWLHNVIAHRRTITVLGM